MTFTVHYVTEMYTEVAVIRERAYILIRVRNITLFHNKLEQICHR